MTLIRHCIIDKNTNLVINIVEYETIQNNTPPGLDSNLFCIQSEKGQIGGTYSDGLIINPKVVEINIIPVLTTA